jgi:hypothetical protein
MRVGKSPGFDGVVLEFYREFLHLIGEEYLQMVQSSIQEGQFPPRVTKGMIALLHRGGERAALINWRPIILLNLSFNFFAKTVFAKTLFAKTLRLQLILTEIISCEQLAFLPLQFI